MRTESAGGPPKKVVDAVCGGVAEEITPASVGIIRAGSIVNSSERMEVDMPQILQHARL